MRRLAREESGFTIVEMLVTTVIVLVVLFATLDAFDTFSKAGSRNDRLTQGQDYARQRIGEMTNVIRNARPAGSATTAIQSASANDLVVSTIDWPGEGATTSAAHLVRYCVNTTTKTLYFDGLQTPASGSTSPGSACPSTASGWTHSALLTGNVLNTASAPLFRYDSATVSAIHAVAIDLRLDTSGNGLTRTTPLRSAAYLRSFSGQAPNLTGSDITVGCDTSTHAALLTLATSFDSDGNPLTATYQSSTGTPLGSGAVTLQSSAQGVITVTVTNVLGLSQVFTKTVSC